VSEIAKKLDRIRKWLEERKLDALYLQRASSFSWATCGAASYVNMASSDGAAALLITQDKQYLFTSNIEAPRLEKEEKLASQGWDFRISPWYSNNNKAADLFHGLRTGSDCAYPGTEDCSAELARLRANLTPEEGQRFHNLGQRCAQGMEVAIKSVRPGQTEQAIAARLAQEVGMRGPQVTVDLVAADERIALFRHPLPTSNKLRKYAMLVVCGRQDGLVCSLTRLVHFGRLPEDLRQKSEAVAGIDAAMIAATRPGRSLSEIFQITIDGYKRAGYPNEWQLHHQGGPAGYEPREYYATPSSTERVTAGQVYAWNPSITGSKSEDTILVGEGGNEILTEIPSWPALVIDGIQRPAILVV
jgi:Xaa-Pro aminopeptidase